MQGQAVNLSGAGGRQPGEPVKERSGSSVFRQLSDGPDEPAASLSSPKENA